VTFAYDGAPTLDRTVDLFVVDFWGERYHGITIFFEVLLSAGRQ